jgi:hypothetical protein
MLVWTCTVCIDIVITLVLCSTDLPRPNNRQKADKPDGKPVLCHKTFSSVFRAVIYTVKLHSLT